MVSKRPPDLLTIGEACELTGFAASALRFYESIELLEPDWVDPSTGYRYFRPGKLLFLNFLKSMKENGLGLAALKPLVPVPEVPALQAALAGRAKAVRQQLKVLRRQLKWLTEASEKFGRLEESAPRLASFPAVWAVESSPGTYDFQGYARARHALVARVHRLDLPWKDDFCVRLPLNPAAAPELGPAVYSLEVAPAGESPAGAVLREAGRCAVEQVRGPVQGVFQRTMTLTAWALGQGLAVGPYVELRHLVSTAHTSNPADFLTEIRLPVR